MEEVKIDPLSYVAIPIEMRFSETNTCLATGTGFIYNSKEKSYFITNWHNVTGIHPDTEQRLSDHAGIPDTIVLTLQFSRKPMQWKQFQINLYEDKNLEKPGWFVHPKHGKKIDVVALELEIPEQFDGILRPINKIPFADFTPRVADEIYILGFPIGMKGGGSLPIWKRGSIATEPDISYDGLPKLLVDTASISGMSGSPVIWRRNGLHHRGTKLANDSLFGEIQGFVGVYSGRVPRKSKNDAQLGIVWKSNVISEVINGGIHDKVSNFNLV